MPETSIDIELPYIFRQLDMVDHKDTDSIRKLEVEIYDLLKQNTENSNALVALMQVEIMLGQKQKAKSLANRIWEIGGGFDNGVANRFLSSLLNIGMIEMASILLKPKFERLEDNIDDSYDLLIKFSLMTGNNFLIEKTNNNNPHPEDQVFIEDFIAVYKQLNYLDHFKAMQKTVLETIRENLCSYEYSFFNTRDFSEVDIRLYTDLNEAECDRILQDINTKLDFYCLTNKITRLDNVHFFVHNIKEKP